MNEADHARPLWVRKTSVLASLIIVFREVLEAGLIVGIVLAATEGVPGRGAWIAGGIVSGVIGAAVVATGAGALSTAFEGIGQEVFTASVLGLAVLMLGWHCVWMARHSRETAGEMTAVGAAVKVGEKPMVALATVVGIAVLREGSEVVLFLYGIAKSSKEGPLTLATGGALGISLGALVAYLLYRGLLAIPMRHLFSVTNGLVAVLAAGMAGQAASVLAGVDILPRWGSQLWNTSSILSEHSLLGRVLHTLIGYSDRPSGIQLAAYLATLLALILLTRFAKESPSSRRAVLRPADEAIPRTR